MSQIAIVEGAAAVIAASGFLWRTGKRIARGVEAISNFASHSSKQIDRIADNLDSFRLEVTSISKRVDLLEKFPQKCTSCSRDGNM